MFGGVELAQVEVDPGCGADEKEVMVMDWGRRWAALAARRRARRWRTRMTFQTGQLKRLPRAGWLRAGIRDPRISRRAQFRVATLAYAIAFFEGADPQGVLLFTFVVSALQGFG